MSEPTEIDSKLDALTNGFAHALNALSTNPALRDGLVKAAILDVVWAIYHEMPEERHALVDGLEGMDDIIRRQIGLDRPNASAA